MTSSSFNARSLSAWITEKAPASPGISRAPRILVAAFEGWNDAGEVATDAVEEIGRQTNAAHLGDLHEEEYYDYQVHRPVITRDVTGTATMSWPSSRVLHSPAGSSHSAQPELYLVVGIEPSLNWRSYVTELLDSAESWDVDAVVMVGALLADVPHSRPLTPTVSSADSKIADEMEGVAVPNYEGPTGIVGVLANSVIERGWPGMSTWVAVPHYVAQAPSPKALLAMLTRLEELLDLRLDLKALSDDAAAWERGVNELAEEDPDVASYIQRLEQAKDTEELPEASGESIAQEFQRYLMRRDEGDDETNM